MNNNVDGIGVNKNKKADCVEEYYEIKGISVLIRSI